MKKINGVETAPINPGWIKKRVPDKYADDDLLQERIVIYKGNYNRFLSICYHIRNALAHGRLAMYERNNEIIFALEDGIKKQNKFHVRSRMILKKSTLLKWIDIVEGGGKD